MRIYCFLLLLFSMGCANEKPTAREALPGKWLVLYPDHQLKGRAERKVYAKYQDSIVNLFGLKLIELKPNNEFIEVDSLFRRPAKWVLNEADLAVQEGGKGFNPFRAVFEKEEADTLQLSQLLPLEGEKIKVVWHLKKLDDDSNAVKLFSPEANAWRKKPAAPESETAIRNRLVAMLDFYSSYLKLVSKESSYFLVPRVPLPFKYYQHSLGMRDTLYPGFTRVFYNEEDAQKGYAILETTVAKLKDSFKWGENFVVEYAQFFQRMAVDIKYPFTETSQAPAVK